MSLSIPCIFIHNKVDYAMVSSYLGCTLDHIKAQELMTVNTSDSTFSKGSGKNPHTTIGSSIYQSAMFSLWGLGCMIGKMVVDCHLRNHGGFLRVWYLVYLVSLKSLVQILRAMTLTAHKVKNGVIRDV